MQEGGRTHEEDDDDEIITACYSNHSSGAVLVSALLEPGFFPLHRREEGKTFNDEEDSNLELRKPLFRVMMMMTTVVVCRQTQSTKR